MDAPYAERAAEVIYLIEQCGLGRHLPVFEANDVDDACLGTLTGEDFAELGLPMGPRARLARAIRERNAAAAVTPAAPPPPPPPADPSDDDDDLCELCWDRERDCRLAGCGHAFCRTCVADWRRQSAAKAQVGASCPTCRKPFGIADVVDLESGRRVDAPRPAWGGAAAAPPVPFPCAAEADRRRREAEVRAAAEVEALRRRREAEVARARAAAEAEALRRRREAEEVRAREAEARRRLEAGAERVREKARRAVAKQDEALALNATAAALAAANAAKDAGQWAAREVTSTAADVRAEAFQRARAAMSGAAWGTTVAGGVYVEAYVTAATGAFEDACVRAVDRAAAFAAARAAHDAAVDRDEAAAAVISVYVDEAVAACRRDAAASAIVEAAERHRRELQRRRVHASTIGSEILALVDAHGGEVGIAQLGALFRARYDKEIDYKGLGCNKMSTLLQLLPDVTYYPQALLCGGYGIVRRAKRPADPPSTLAGDAAEFQPAPVAPSRSASPDPTAAPWTPAPPMPFPYGPPPPGGYFTHPFILQPFPPAQHLHPAQYFHPPKRTPAQAAAYERAVANAKYPAGSRRGSLGPAAPAGWVDGGRGYDV